MSEKQKGERDHLPFPDSELSPAFQRTIRRKLERARAASDGDGPSRARFARVLREVAAPKGRAASPDSPPE